MVTCCRGHQQLSSFNPAWEKVVVISITPPTTLLRSTEAAISLALFFISQTPSAVDAYPSAVARG
jgi:hypothetical protein